MKLRFILLISLFAVVSPAQLSTDQRLADLNNLADLYARRYASIAWKQTVVDFDVLNLAPWISRVNAITNDLDFYDLLVEYVSDLQDAHDQYFLPSDFEAHLGFTVDIYDGKVLIDSIDRTVLAASDFPFQNGDELVSVDGKKSADLVNLFSKYVTGGNPRTVQRLAAELITDRYQEEYPRAHEIGDNASVVVLRQSGTTETYTIPWQKLGIALTGLGSSPGPRTTAQAKLRSTGRMKARAQAQQVSGAPIPLYQQMLQQLRNYTLPGRINVVGFDASAPVFALPKGFVVRLGKRLSDFYYTGTYTASDGTRIGYLRIPDFTFLDDTNLDKEIRYFQANTDALVVDEMRNPGGDVCVAEQTLSRLTTQDFQGSAAEVRVDWSDILAVDFALTDALNNGADDDTIALLQLLQTEYPKAFFNGGRTGSLPICGSTLTRSAGVIAYSKPVLVLVDEMSASSADIFAAMVQDNHIAPLFGYRTMGAGGSPEGDYAGVYTEGSTYVTRSLITRPQPIVTPDYPTTTYIENVGVRPETVVDYMTADNLVNQGATFVNAFTAAAVKLVKGGN